MDGEINKQMKESVSVYVSNAIVIEIFSLILGLVLWIVCTAYLSAIVQETLKNAWITFFSFIIFSFIFYFSGLCANFLLMTQESAKNSYIKILNLLNLNQDNKNQEITKTEKIRVLKGFIAYSWGSLFTFLIIISISKFYSLYKKILNQCIYKLVN
jgi:pheromone shutdown protein TraB